MHRENRKRSVVSLVLGLTAVLMFAAGSASAQQTKPIPVNHCGQTLNQAGKTYVLTTDLDCSGSFADGLDISASNVTFHLGNHTLSSTDCDLSRQMYGIFVPGNITNVKIDGGTVRGFEDGVVLSSTKSRVSGMTVTGACVFGIAVQNDGNTVTTNRVTHNGWDGIGLQVATHTQITANDVSGNFGNGVALANNSHNNSIVNNILSSNGAAGVLIQGSDVNNNYSNTVANNALDGNVWGIEVDNPENFVHYNTIRGNLDAGIWLTVYGSASQVMHNTVLGSARTDMLDDSPSCGGNTWRNDFFDTDLVDGVPDGGMNVGCAR